MRSTTFASIVLLFLIVRAERDLSNLQTFEASMYSPYPRIVGGREATPHSFPYQAALIIEKLVGVYLCGGSIISQKYILTAAHCVDKAILVEVTLGAHNFRVVEPEQQRYIVSTIKVHKKWNRRTKIGDIAVLELPVPIQLNENIQIVALPSRSDVGKPLSGKLSIVSGWGRFSDSVPRASKVLRHVETEVITNSACSIFYLGGIKPSHICTSGFGGKSTCGGDSGGPLLVDQKQMGIVSFGIVFGCEVGWPAVFTRVTKYLDWIAANTDVVIT